MKKIAKEWFNAAVKLVFWVTMFIWAGAGLSYGAIVGLNIYAALHGG